MVIRGRLKSEKSLGNFGLAMIKQRATLNCKEFTLPLGVAKLLLEKLAVMIKSSKGKVSPFLINLMQFEGRDIYRVASYNNDP